MGAGFSNDDCCRKFDDNGNMDLLEACGEQKTEMITMKEVYETKSETCDAVVLERTVGYLASNGMEAAIWYYAPHMDSTLLRCCLAQEDWMENINACLEPEAQDPETSYEYKVPDGADEGTPAQCFEDSCVRSNIYAPGSGTRRVLVEEGECISEDGFPKAVEASVCCENGVLEACEDDSIEEKEGDPDVQDVMCVEDEEGMCNECMIMEFPVTEYLDSEGMVINSVTSDMLVERTGDRAECCAAGVLAMDEETIRAACLNDDGEPEDELEFTDQGECIQRSVQKKGYLDMDGMPIDVEGFESFEEVLDTEILESTDACCSQGCMGEEFTSFLAACDSRMETPGMKSYAVGPEKEFCIETQEVIIVYGLSNGDEACSVTAGVEKSSQFEGDEVPEHACCAVAVADSEIGATEETLDEYDDWCDARDETSEGATLDFDDSVGEDG